MDRFAAHLDRGWDLVQQGDTRGAEASARRALELNEEAPEAFNLLGYAAALRGDFDEAVRLYNQALTLDENYFEALLNAAEVLIHPLSEYAQASELCERALGLADSEDELIEALLLKFDALLGEDQNAAAKALCARFPEGPFDNPNHSFLIGRALYEVGETARSSPFLEAAVKQNSQNAEAFYYLGLLREEQGDRNESTHAFARARALDLQSPPAEWSLTAEAFEQTVRQVIENLDPEFSRIIRPDQIYVVEVPGLELVIDGVDPRALLLMDDIAAQQGDEEPTARLFVYQRNIERVAGSLEALQEELRSALEREVTAIVEEEDLEELSQRPSHLLN